MNATTTKTEQLIATCRTPKGATAEQLTEATGQTMQVVRSRLYTLTKAGRVAAVPESSPRRYTAAKTAPATKAPAKAAAKKAPAKAPAKRTRAKRS